MRVLRRTVRPRREAGCSTVKPSCLCPITAAIAAVAPERKLAARGCYSDRFARRTALGLLSRMLYRAAPTAIDHLTNGDNIDPIAETRGAPTHRRRHYSL